MKFTALLPMKYHSERVSGKNMKPFNGLPLYTYIIKTLDNCASVESIIINTDSPIIAEATTKISDKVHIHERPQHLCGDFVPMNNIIAYDIQQSNKDFFIQTHSTNPLLKSETIQKALELFKEFKDKGDPYDSIFSVTRLQTRLYWQNGSPINHNPNELIRTQDLPPVFEENSNFYIFSKQSFLQAGNKRIGQFPFMFEINKLEAIDIDEPADFILAETIHKLNIV
jgi:N-acylneuraminate cytidylyltransferase